MHGYSRANRAAAGLVLAALVTGCTGTAAADTPIAPVPRPVIGPVQYGPPGYPGAIGVPRVPQARSGVAISVDSLAPEPLSQPPASAGISGVHIGADPLVAVEVTGEPAPPAPEP